jgi:hypothetical protein
MLDVHGKFLIECLRALTTRTKRRIGRVLRTSLIRAQHANRGGFAGSEVWVALQRLGGTRVAFLHARTPTHSPPDVKTGRSTPRSLCTLLHLCMSLFCLLRVWLFAMERVLTWLDLTKTTALAINLSVPITSASPYLNPHISAKSWHMKTTKPPYCIVTLRKYIFRSQKCFCFHLHLQLSWWRRYNVTSTSLKLKLKMDLKKCLRPANRI